MDEINEIEPREVLKKIRKPLIVIMCIVLLVSLTYLGYGVGASTMCKKNGGVLLSDFSCANTSMIQYCQKNNEFYKLPIQGLNVSPQ